MPRQTAFKLLYDDSYLIINKKEHAKYIITLRNQKKIFLYYIRMAFTSQNNGINAIKEARKLFNEVRSNLSCEETKRIRKKLYKKEDGYNFLKKKSKKVV